MISLPTAVKNAYKDYDRELEVFGKLYLSTTQRPSTNKLDQTTYMNTANCEFLNGEFEQTLADTATSSYVVLQAYNGTTYVRELDRYSMALGNVVFSFTTASDYNRIRFKINGSQIDTSVMFDISNLGLSLNTTYYFGATFTNITQGSITFKDIYIAESGNGYEEYGTMINVYSQFELTKENNCQILSFNINEKTDLYYTSLPYNTMTLEVNNENGYFTVEDEDSIIDSLNGECYVDLYMKINNGTAYKIMTMEFEKVSYSDYEKAKLEFHSCLYRVNNSEVLYDTNYNTATRRIPTYCWGDYLKKNYNINFLSDHIHFSNEETIPTAVNNQIRNLSDLKSFVIFASCRTGAYGAEELITTDYNNNLFYKAISNIAVETITSNLQYQKPLIKKDNIYKCVKGYEYSTDYQFEQTNITYSRTISHKLKSKRNVIVIRDNVYKLNDITTSDISVISGTANVSIIPSQNELNLILMIKGNIGDEIQVNITKNNIYKLKELPIEEYTLGTYDENTDKTLIIKETAIISSAQYPIIFLYIKKPVLNFIEAQIKGLPYLETGDTITIELENANKKIVITEIDMNFDGGLTETIKGYELDWTHKHYKPPYNDLNYWDGLLPDNNLYPGNDVYPY